LKKTMLLPLVIFITTLGLANEDFLSDLNTTKEEVQKHIENSIGSKYLSCPEACRLVPAGKRAAIVRAVGEFARSYVKSEGFKNWYAKYREGHKPAKPDLMKSAANNRGDQIGTLRKSIADLEKARSEAPANMKDMYTQNIAAMKKMLKETEQGNPDRDRQMDKYSAQSNEEAGKEYNKKVAEWEKEYPAGDPRPLLKKRLREFLGESAGVNYNAKIIIKDGRKIFADPNYEKKNGNWKMCFRAGREATEAARSFAQAWLKGL